VDAGDGEIEEVVSSYVREGVAPLDGAAVALAHRADSLDCLLELDRIVTCHTTHRPARVASQSCGRQLAALANHLADDPLLELLVIAVHDGSTDANLAVVSGSLARSLGIGRPEALMLELRGAMMTLLSCAVRLGRLGPVGAQAMAHRLVPDLILAASEALEMQPLDLHSSAVELDLAALAHSRRDARPRDQRAPADHHVLVRGEAMRWRRSGTSGAATRWLARLPSEPLHEERDAECDRVVSIGAIVGGPIPRRRRPCVEYVGGSGSSWPSPS
jgi:urease accessory protein